MKYRYIAKPDKYGRIFHLTNSLDNSKSLCGTAHVGVGGYEHVDRDRPAPSAMRCKNCTQNIIAGGR